MRRYRLLLIIGIWGIYWLTGSLSIVSGQTALTVHYVDLSNSAFPLQDPFAEIWKQAPVTRVTLLPQNVTTPNLEKLAVEWIDVRAIHNGSQVAFLLQWPDATQDGNIDVDRFTDAVAIELPLDAEIPPSFMMGHPGGRVQIIHWKAIWQKDIDEGFQDVRSLHPNYWVDLYFFAENPVPLFAEGEFPRHPAAQSFKTPEALAQLSGAYVRNPVSVLDRKVPVEEAMAEGFGTLTSQPRQDATGRGVWKEGQWHVVISRPLVTSDTADAQFSAGQQSVIAFAVWDGGQKNVGARKQYAPWIPLSFEEVK